MSNDNRNINAGRDVKTTITNGITSKWFTISIATIFVGIIIS